MGKQIEFFITKEEEFEFFKSIMESGNLLLDNKAVSLTLDEATNSNAISLFLAPTDAIIIKSDSGFLDAIVSDAIQYSRGIRKDDKSLRSSRLWLEQKYFHNNELIVKSKKIIELFDSYAKWIKKNYFRSKCKNYYIGNKAYVLYKEKGYSMVAGPKHMVEFD